MNPDLPNSITAAELAALGELARPDAELPLAPAGPRTTGGIPPVSDVERRLFGDLADPEAFRAFEANAAAVRRAVQAGATEKSLYAAGRVPEAGDDVILGDAPARVLKVRDPGEAMARLDLLQYSQGEPTAFSAVQHDRANGWHWLNEPPPSDPTPADRIRAALAAGKPVPKVGEVVRILRAKPRSYLGVQMIALRARVLEQVDVIGDRVILDLEVLDDLVDGLDPATASGIIRGVEGPEDYKEGWSRSAPPSRVLSPDNRDIGTRSCDRCGSKIPPKDAVDFLARTFENYTHPVIYSRLCPTCADQLGRLAFVRPPASESVQAASADGDLDELA